MNFNLMADIDPTAFTLFGIEIKWYAIMIVTGMLLGMLVSARLMSRRGEKGDIVIDFAIVVLPLAIIGARLYYMIFAPQEADRRSFWALFEFWNGLNWWGILVGLVLAFLVALLCVKINPLKFCRIQKPKEGDKLLPKGRKDWTVLTLVTVLLGLFLARICWLLADDPQGYIYRLFNIRGGGLAIYGGVILGAAGVIIVCVAKKIQLEKDRLPDGRHCARADSGSGHRQMGQLLQSGGLRAADYRRRIAVLPLRRVHRFTAEMVSGDVLL